MGKAAQQTRQAKRARPASEMSAPRPNDTGAGSADDGTGGAMLTAFSPDTRLFAALSPAAGKDRLRVWNITSAPPASVSDFNPAYAEAVADVVVPDAQASALVWVDVPSSPSTSAPTPRGHNAKKGRASNGTNGSAATAASASTSASTQQLALGTLDGRVLIFDPTHAAFTLVLSDAQFSPSAAGIVGALGERKVTGVDSHAGTVYVSSADGLVRWFNLAGANAGTLSPSKRLLPAHSVRPQVVAAGKAGLVVGHHELQLYPAAAVEALEPVQGVARGLIPLITYTGHSTPVTHICWLGAQRFLSAAQDDRTVYVWDVPHGQTPAHGGVPQGIITLDAPVRTLVPAGADPQGGRRVLIVDTAGLVSLYVVPLSLEKKTDQPIRRRKFKGGAIMNLRPESSIRVVTASTGNGKVLPILNVGPDPSTQGYRMVVTLARMVRGAKLALDTILLHPGDKEGAYAPAIEVVRTKEVLAETGGEAGAPNLGRFAPKGEALQLAQEPKSKKSKGVVEKVAAVGSSSGAPLTQLGISNIPSSAEVTDTHANVEELDEPSLAVRLQSLQMPQPADEDVTAAPRSLGQFDGAGVAQALTQALHSQDQALTTELLLVAKVSRSVLQASVARLTGPLAVRLLEACLDRLEVTGTRLNSGRTNRLVDWIRCALVAHSGYLMSLPSLLPRLFQVHTALSSRLAHHERLAKLQGRLELVLAQIDTKAEHAPHLQIPGVSQDRRGPLVEGVAEGDVWIEPDESDADEADDLGEVDDIVPVDGSDNGADDADGLDSDLDDMEMEYESDPDGDSDDVESSIDEAADSEDGAPSANNPLGRRKAARGSVSVADDDDSSDEDEE